MDPRTRRIEHALQAMTDATALAVAGEIATIDDDSERQRLTAAWANKALGGNDEPLGAWRLNRPESFVSGHAFMRAE